MKVIPKRSFLVRQTDLEGGKKKDVYATKGVRMEMSEEEAVRFYGSLELNDADKKKLQALSRTGKYRRLV